MRGYLFKDISELPCSLEQIFAEIVLPRDQNNPIGHCRIWMVTRLLLYSFISGLQLLEAEAVFRIPGLLDLETA